MKTNGSPKSGHISHPVLDEHLVREIVLYIENTSELYPQYLAICKNYAKKRVKGVYDVELATQGVLNLVKAGISRYRQELGSLGTVNKQEKWYAASEILAGMTEQIEDYEKELRQ